MHHTRWVNVIRDEEKSIGKGFAILSVANILVRLLSLIYVPLLTNILGDDGYGVYGITYTVFSFIYIIATSGITVAISKYVSELSKKNYHKAALRAFKMARAYLILIGFILSVIMAALSGWLAALTKTPEIKTALIVLAPCIFFTAVLSAYRGYFQGRQQMRPTAITQIVEQVVNIIFSIAFAVILIKKSQELGVAGGSVGTSLGALAALIIIIIMFKRYFKRGFAIPGDNVRFPHNYKRISRTLIKYSIPITICTAVQFGGTMIDAWNTKGRLLVSGLLGLEANTQFGYLSKSQQFINVPVSLVTALAIAMLPAIASSIAVNDRRAAAKKIMYSFRLCYIICVPAAFGLMVLSRGVYQILFQSAGVEVLLYSALTIILLATAQIQTSILQSVNRLYQAVFSMAIGIIIKIAMNYYLIAIPSIRIYGAIISTAVSMFTVICINQYIINKKERLRIKIISMIWRPVCSSIYMAAVISVLYVLPQRMLPGIFSGYIANLILVGFSTLVGVFVYFVIMARLKGLKKDDISSISPKAYKILPRFMKKMLT